MVRISAIGTAVPNFQIEQRKLGKQISELMELDNKTSRVLHTMLRFSGIENRYSVIKDFSFEHKQDRFYTHEKPPTTQSRMKIYSEEAHKLAISAVKDCIENYNINNERTFDLGSVTDLIIVSCTGLYSPGIENAIIKEFGLRKDINKLLIQFMGCCAAFNGLKTANFICKNENNRKVLLVCVELSTIHFQYENKEDNLRANVLFSDGASCAIIENNDNNGNSLCCCDFKSLYVNEASKDMMWSVTDNGFEMRLSENVPDLIKNNMDLFLDLFEININTKDYHFAIHPGGVKILRVIEEYFGITSKELYYSYEILRKYGNMSSATILFVLKEYLYSKNRTKNKIFACSFGPGLTCEGGIFTFNI